MEEQLRNIVAKVQRNGRPDADLCVRIVAAQHRTAIGARMRIRVVARL